MSQQYPGGFITKSPPATVGPVDGEGGSAPGVWTLDQAMALNKQGLWPKPPLPRQLWSWGNNVNGQLGLGTTVSVSSPNQVGSLTDWYTLSMGVQASAAIKSDGTLWTWGNNSSGQLGQGNVTDRSSPVQVGALTTWSKVATTGEHCLAIRTDGTLWAWGLNNQGQLGLGNSGAGTNRSSPVQVGALTTWSRCWVGYRYSLAIKTDGTLWAWGQNSWGQLGLGNQTHYSSPKQVGALTTWSEANGGNSHTLARTTAGTLWAWGRNNAGQLGINITYTSYSSPKQVGALTTWASVNINLGDSSAAVGTNGTLWTWGLNSIGNLGLNSAAYAYSSPKQVGALTNWSTKTIMTYYNCFAIKTDGTLWGWGWNDQGALGLGNATNYSSPKQIGSLTSWLAVASGQINALAIKTP